NQQNRGNEGRHCYMPLLARPYKGADRQRDYQHTHNGCYITVKLLKKGVIVYSSKKGLTITERPIRATQTRIRGAYRATQCDKKICEGNRCPRNAAYKFHRKLQITHQAE